MITTITLFAILTWYVFGATAVFMAMWKKLLKINVEKPDPEIILVIIFLILLGGPISFIIVSRHKRQP